MYYEDYVEQDPDEKCINSQKFRVSSLGRVQLTNGCYQRIFACSLLPNWPGLEISGSSFGGVNIFLNEEGKEYVNDINGNSTNNRASNLEWCILKENVQHAVHLGITLLNVPSSRSIQELFSSIAEARRVTGIDNVNIGRVCRGIRNHAGGCR